MTDVSELPACGTKLYLSPVVDCFDGLPAAWGLSRHPDSSLCDGSLAAYLDGLPAGSPPTVHADGGGPYRAASWKGLCSRRGVARSMSRRGRCGGNARAEGFFGTLKVEFLYRRDWSRASPDEFRAALADYMGWYQEGRLKPVRGAGRDEALRDHHGPQAQAGTDGVGWSKKSSTHPRVRQNSRTCAPANAHKPEIRHQG